MCLELKEEVQGFLSFSQNHCVHLKRYPNTELDCNVLNSVAEMMMITRRKQHVGFTGVSATVIDKASHNQTYGLLIYNYLIMASGGFYTS